MAVNFASVKMLRNPCSGGELLSAILYMQKETTVIISLSLHQDASYCRNMIRLGAKGYVTKSSPYRDIIAAINEVAGGGKYIDKNIPGMH